MAARHCSRCLITFPAETIQCPVCNYGLPYTANSDPDPDWEHKAALAAEVGELAEVHSEEEAVIFNRMRRLLEAGLPYDQAIKLAQERSPEGGYLVDIATFEKIMERNHWTAEQVAAVLG